MHDTLHSLSCANGDYIIIIIFMPPVADGMNDVAYRRRGDGK